MINSNRMPQITWASLTLGKLIGNGSFGDVYQGTWREKKVAIKLLQMKTLAPALAQDFTKEAKLMWEAKGENTLNLLGICLEDGHSAMITEYMDKGSLYHVITNQELTIDRAWQIALDMAKGLAHLHSKDIIHRDLKSFNVLIDKDYHAKISDFGLAKLKTATSSSSSRTKQVGSIRWRAPELFKRGAQANKASDIYSLGMVLWELVSKKLPFSDATDDITVMGWIKDGEQEEIPADCPEVWQNIIKSCWGEVDKRPSALEIVAQLEAAMPKDKPAITNKSWHFAIKPDSSKLQSDYALLKAAKEDYDKVQTYYQHHPVPGYDIASIEVIYNPNLNRSFSLKMALLQKRHNNLAFAPRWQQEDNPAWRKEVHDAWQNMAEPYQDIDYPNVKLLPLWHGTKPEILGSLFETGYANLATTDAGFFGKGLYSAYEADYSYRVYSKGALILNWVASYSTYPVIDGDMGKLAEKGNYANYDSHFIPVVPANPNNPLETDYFPTHPHQKALYHEMVVFDNGQCLPRYLVTLQKTLLKAPPYLKDKDKQKEEEFKQASLQPAKASTTQFNNPGNPFLNHTSPQAGPLAPPSFTNGTQTTITTPGAYNNQTKANATLVANHGNPSLNYLSQTMPSTTTTLAPRQDVSLKKDIQSNQRANYSQAREIASEPIIKVGPIDASITNQDYTTSPNINHSPQVQSAICHEPVNTSISLLRDKPIITQFNNLALDNIANHKSKATLIKTLRGVASISFLKALQDGTLAVSTIDGGIRIFDVTSENVKKTIGKTGRMSTANVIEQLPNGELVLAFLKLGFGTAFSLLISQECKGCIRICDIKSGKHLRTMKGQTTMARCLQLLPNGKLASASKCYIKIWDTESASCLKTLKGHKDTVSCLQLLFSGELISSSRHGVIKIWEVDSGRCIRTIETQACIEFLQPLPDGNVISGSKDGAIKIWDITSGKCCKIIKEHSDITCLKLLPNGLLVSGANDGTINLWNLDSSLYIILGQQYTPVNYLELLPDSKLASAGTYDINIWDVAEYNLKPNSKSEKEIILSNQETVKSVGASHSL